VTNASTGAAMRLARRMARCDWKRTAFVMALIAVPVAVAIVVAGIVRSGEVDPETGVAAAFGSATLRVESGAVTSEVAAQVADQIGSLEAPTLSYRSMFTRIGGSDDVPVEDLDVSTRSPSASST